MIDAIAHGVVTRGNPGDSGQVGYRALSCPAALAFPALRAVAALLSAFAHGPQKRS